MPAPVEQTIRFLAQMVQGLPVGTNQALLHLASLRHLPAKPFGPRPNLRQDLRSHLRNAALPASPVIGWIISLLSYGCPPLAIVATFGVDPRDEPATWPARWNGWKGPSTWWERFTTFAPTTMRFGSRSTSFIGADLFAIGWSGRLRWPPD